MPATANYGWIYPTEGGDIGTWDTILNTLFIDADVDVKAVEDIAVKDLTHKNAQFIVPGGDLSQYWFGSILGTYENAAGNPLNDTNLIRLDLRVGTKITGFSTRGVVSGARACVASLVYVTIADASETQVSAGHSFLGALTTQTTSSLNHAVVAGRTYFVKLTPSGGTGTDGAQCRGVNVAVATV